jgi:hypothetical protein
MARRRFLVAYAILAIATAAIGVGTWKASTLHRPHPVGPGAVRLVDSFLGAVQRGDLVTACRLFSSYPACDPQIGVFPLKTYRIGRAEVAVGGFDVPATLNGEYALFSVKGRLGNYRIDDIVADPAGPIQAEFPA